jgi:Ras-related protein Rab-1A
MTSDLISQDYDYLFKVLLLGDSDVGKSSLILRYTEETFNSKLVNSIGVDFKMKKREIDGKVIKVQIWDTAGHERFRSITYSYYRGANAIIIVFDLSDKKSFISITEWLKQIEKHAKENVFKFLVGNKSDLVEQRKVSYDEAKQYADEHELPYIETSAKEGININELFDSSIKSFLNNSNNFSGEKNIKLNSQNTTSSEKGICC